MLSRDVLTRVLSMIFYFYICSVDGLNQILEFFACKCIFIFTNTMTDTINSTDFWNNSRMCLAMSHHPYIFGFAAA